MTPSAAHFGKVAVILGGRSAEREVSLKSGGAVLHSLRARGVDAHGFDPAENDFAAFMRRHFDRAFIALHGRFGEDGTLQGAFETIGLPYTGSGVAASALALDKWRSKLVFQASGIATPRFVLATDAQAAENALKHFGLPLVVKPANEGSSIGVSIVREAAHLAAAIAAAQVHDAVVLIEEFCAGAELTVGVLGRRALPVIRLETPRTFYDYQAKYLADDTRYLIPSGLGEAADQQVQTLAMAAFDAVGARGWGRVDLMLDAAGRGLVLEVNTVPGMTDHSLVTMAARAAGIEMEQLVWEILAQTLTP